MTLYIFDKDNTLLFSYPHRPANTVGEQVALPNVVEKCRQLREAGHILAIASNQGGVASGKIDEAIVIHLMNHCTDLVGANSYRYCPHSSRRDECNCRKPKPGMILSLMREFEVSAADTVFVGDADTDKSAAEAAGIRFVWAAEFFGWPEGFNTILEDNNDKK